MREIENLILPKRNCNFGLEIWRKKGNSIEKYRHKLLMTAMNNQNLIIIKRTSYQRSFKSPGSLMNGVSQTQDSEMSVGKPPLY